MLHCSRGYDQLVVLQGCFFDMPPQRIGVRPFTGFPVKAVVKTTVECLHKLGGKNRARKLMTIGFGRPNVEVKIVIDKTETELNVAIEPAALELFPL